MKFDELIKYNKRYAFFKNHAENEAKRVVPEFFKKSFIWGKNKVSAAEFRFGWTAFSLYAKFKLYKTLDY